MKSYTPKKPNTSSPDHEPPECPEWLIGLTREERRREALEMIRVMNEEADPLDEEGAP